MTRPQPPHRTPTTTATRHGSDSPTAVARPFPQPRLRPPASILSTLLLTFLGLTAVGGGVEMWLYPQGNRYVPGEWLAGIPLIESWRLPGLVLFTLFGLGSLVTAYGVLRRPRWHRWNRLPWAGEYHWARGGMVILGVALVGWILLEVAWIPVRSPIELIYGVIGSALVLLATRPSMRRYLRHPSRAAGTKPAPGNAPRSGHCPRTAR